MAELNMGATLYDANKQIIEQQKPLTHLELARKQEIIENWFDTKIVTYSMLLCHERRDYTIFRLGNTSTATYTAARDLMECLTNRGEIMAIDKADEKENAYEIWLKIDGEAFAYYLFPYDAGVIECE